MVKQDNFSIMRGHVYAGNTIQCGQDTLTMSPSGNHIGGWKATDQNGNVVIDAINGYDFEYQIVNYNR